MLRGRLRWLPMLFCLLCVTVYGQEMKLDPGKLVERELAGGESHTYQITLTAGQFVRFRLEQRALDGVLILTAPDGKQMAEVNMTDAGEPESLALEALPAGSYRLTVRGVGGVTMRGSYRLEAAAQATAAAQDRKHLAAQSLLLEAIELGRQMPGTAPEAIEKREQALTIWRELGMADQVALTLNGIGRAYMRQNQNEKAIPYLEQALSINRELKNRFGEAFVLNSLANVYFNLRQNEKALEIFERALAVYRDVKDRR